MAKGNTTVLPGGKYTIGELGALPAKTRKAYLSKNPVTGGQRTALLNSLRQRGISTAGI